MRHRGKTACVARFNKRVFFGVAIVLTVFFVARTANATLAYEIGMPTQFDIVPGEIVSIPAVLTNIGDEPITFAPSVTFIGNALPSVQGGAVPGITFNNDLSANWLLTNYDLTLGPTFGGPADGSNFFPQFDGVTVAPGDSFSFVIGTFEAPTDQPLGSFAEIQDVSLEIYFTDTVWGTNRNLSNALFSYFLDNGPSATFTLSDSALVGDVEFRQAMVINVATGQLISGPADVTGGLRVPEPASLALFAPALLGFAFFYRRKRA